MGTGMTISGTTNRNQYTGNGATTVFARTFFVSDADHLKVYQTIGSTTTEVTSGITKDGIGTASGNVTFSVAPATGTTITLIREVPVTQETDYVAQGKVSPEQVEDDLDLLVQMLQDLLEEIGRTLKVPLESSLSNLQVPTPVGGAAVGWNASGTALVNLTNLDTSEIGVTAGTNNAVMRYDNAGTQLQDSGVLIDDSDNVTIPGDLNITGDHKIEMADARVGEMIDFGTDDEARYVNFSASRARMGYDGAHGYLMGGVGRGVRLNVNAGDTALFVNASGNLRVGDGTDPTVKAEFAGTDAILLPVGTTAQRPTGAKGYLRHNDDTDAPEFYDGTAWQPLSGGSLARLAQATASNDAVLDFTFTPADYDAIVLACRNLVPATDSAGLLLRVSTDGGATFATTGYNSEVTTRTTPANSTAGMIVADDVGSATDEAGWSGTITLGRPAVVARPMANANGAVISTDGEIYATQAAGIYNTAQDTDAVRLLFSTGNIESGTVTAYGMRSS
jgi:hypothetical protein